eukprot:TRINITY_DN1866_c1_g1_i3.p1 TRINITY_DN1866_c1_g1~~TRINITY_DN1866_c1_g1_i3.p1  ORF type:complete len:621 (+),score=133.89 TRINITY_DN1866_c1_g1_i3:142-2004(+)
MGVGDKGKARAPRPKIVQPDSFIAEDGRYVAGSSPRCMRMIRQRNLKKQFKRRPSLNDKLQAHGPSKKFFEQNHLSFRDKLANGFRARYAKEVIVVDEEQDPILREFCRSLGYCLHCEREGSAEDRVRLTAILVAKAFGGYPLQTPGALSGNALEARMYELIDKANGGNIDEDILIGALMEDDDEPGGGVCRHRAMLFKFACDKFDVAECAMLNGVHMPEGWADVTRFRAKVFPVDHMWNAVRVGDKRYLVDCMHAPGTLMDAEESKVKMYHRFDGHAGLMSLEPMDRPSRPSRIEEEHTSDDEATEVAPEAMGRTMMDSRICTRHSDACSDDSFEEAAPQRWAPNIAPEIMRGRRVTIEEAAQRLNEADTGGGGREASDSDSRPPMRGGGPRARGRLWYPRRPTGYQTDLDALSTYEPNIPLYPAAAPQEPAVAAAPPAVSTVSSEAAAAPAAAQPAAQPASQPAARPAAQRAVPAAAPAAPRGTAATPRRKSGRRYAVAAAAPEMSILDEKGAVKENPLMELSLRDLEPTELWAYNILSEVPPFSDLDDLSLELLCRLLDNKLVKRGDDLFGKTGSCSLQAAADKEAIKASWARATSYGAMLFFTSRRTFQTLAAPKL